MFRWLACKCGLASPPACQSAGCSRCRTAHAGKCGPRQMHTDSLGKSAEPSAAVPYQASCNARPAVELCEQGLAVRTRPAPGTQSPAKAQGQFLSWPSSRLDARKCCSGLHSCKESEPCVTNGAATSWTLIWACAAITGHQGQDGPWTAKAATWAPASDELCSGTSTKISCSLCKGELKAIRGQQSKQPVLAAGAAGLAAQE